MKAIAARAITKRFVIDAEPLTLLNLFRRAVRRKARRRIVEALRGIDFEASPGDRLGVIGDNGSGKTTLLRIIAGLYRPSAGTVSVQGTVAAFLQLGIGMERNLSALENIFLFGAIMGVDRGTLAGKVDDIAEFAEVSDLLDVPLRDYSMGMVQRLALSIARYVDSDVLLLDEMLSSGDVSFREKCALVFDEYANRSKTLIIISHEMGVIRRFCNKALLLDRGVQVAFGPSEEVVDRYERRAFARRA